VVAAVLIRTGVAIPAAYIGGGLGVFEVSDFGRALLDDLRDGPAWQGRGSASVTWYSSPLVALSVAMLDGDQGISAVGPGP
jgi:hypothetical protein